MSEVMSLAPVRVLWMRLSRPIELNLENIWFWLKTGSYKEKHARKGGRGCGEGGGAGGRAHLEQYLLFASVPCQASDITKSHSGATMPGLAAVLA